MKITFQGAAKIVTGSCYLFKVGKIKFLVDCGMFQGPKEIVRMNYLPFKFNPKEISFVLLTHAHIDHSGLIPKLVKYGFNGKIYSTQATKELCKVMLEDSVDVQKDKLKISNRRRLREGQKPRELLYDTKEVQKAMRLFSSLKYNKKQNIGEISVVFKNAGHILGSSMIEVFAEGKKLVFSGDIGQGSGLILNNPEIIKEADYLFFESTYGDRLHIHTDKRLEKLAKVINETHKKGGKLMIPVFAIERTQELIFSLEELYEKKMIPYQKVFLDSPLAIEATEVFKKHPQEYNSKIKFNFKGLESTSRVESSMRINRYDKPAIIMAGSGMCNAGRIRHHIKHNIWNPKNTILFVGYQAKGTLGRVIRSGEKIIRMMGLKLVVKAKVETLDSFSGHADQKMLLSWIKNFVEKPKKVFVIHGEEKASTVLSQKINTLGMKTKIPSIGEVVEL